MFAIAFLFLPVLGDCFKSRRRLEAEILVLRHQLNVGANRRAVSATNTVPIVMVSVGDAAREKQWKVRIYLISCMKNLKLT